MGPNDGWIEITVSILTFNIVRDIDIWPPQEFQRFTQKHEQKGVKEIERKMKYRKNERDKTPSKTHEALNWNPSFEI